MGMSLGIASETKGVYKMIGFFSLIPCCEAANSGELLLDIPSEGQLPKGIWFWVSLQAICFEAETKGPTNPQGPYLQG